MGENLRSKTDNSCSDMSKFEKLSRILFSSFFARAMNSSTCVSKRGVYPLCVFFKISVINSKISSGNSVSASFTVSGTSSTPSRPFFKIKLGDVKFSLKNILKNMNRTCVESKGSSLLRVSCSSLLCSR